MKNKDDQNGAVAPSYTDGYNELTQIVREIEMGETSVDELALKVQRAKELVSFLKNKLTKTEEDVKQILQELGE
jgi:exodeoxyribonuclease VII small subunit